MAKHATISSLPGRSWAGLLITGAVGLAVVLRLLLPIGDLETIIAGPATVAGVLFGGVLWYVARLVEESDSSPRQLIEIANLLTIVRGVLYAIVGGFLVVTAGTTLMWLPAIAYGLGAAIDKLDGTIARTIGQRTPLGERLDMAIDTFGIVVAPLLAVLWGRLPVWYLSLSAARYVYKGGLWYRQRQGRQLVAPPDSDIGRYLAGLQMAFFTAALAPVVPRAIIYTVAPILLTASLSIFVRDFLVVTGRVTYQ